MKSKLFDVVDEEDEDLVSGVFSEIGVTEYVDGDIVLESTLDFERINFFIFLRKISHSVTRVFKFRVD